jgi:hypothetical protein
VGIVADEKVEYGVSPQFLVLDDSFKGAGARLSASKDLDKSSKIQAYADLVAGAPKNGNTFVKPQKIGFEYRRTFAKGGKVSASSRADGCCVKGKTKGRMV